MTQPTLSGLLIPSSHSSSTSTSSRTSPIGSTTTTASNSVGSTAPSSPGEPAGDDTVIFADSKLSLGFGTRAIHVGSEPDKLTGAVIPPISLSTTFAQKEPGVHSGFEYSRSDNPNRRALETALASIEAGGKEGMAFASGSAALATVVQSLQFLKDPSSTHKPIHVLSINDVYGGTYRYLKRVASEVSGLEVTFVDMETVSEEEVRSGIREDTKLILVETPTNPTLKLVSIPLLSRIAHTHPAHPILMVDNTFASPFYQNPLMLGADLVLHSLTKYVNGHSDVVMGAVVVPDVDGSHLSAFAGEEDAPIPHPSPEHLERYYKTLRFMQNALGAVPSAYDSWLAQRGLKTLHLRMKAHGSNALLIGQGVRTWVEGHKDAQVEIGYAGLPPVKGDETQKRRHELAWRMLSEPARKFVNGEVRPVQDLQTGRTSLVSEPPATGFPYTGMLTLTLPTYNHALTFLTSLQLFTLAESLGGVESLAEHPASMTHAGIPPEERRKSGIADGLVRLSVGVEDGADLVRDVVGALERSFKVNGW